MLYHNSKELSLVRIVTFDKNAIINDTHAAHARDGLFKTCPFDAWKISHLETNADNEKAQLAPVVSRRCAQEILLYITNTIEHGTHS